MGQIICKQSYQLKSRHKVEVTWKVTYVINKFRCWTKMWCLVHSYNYNVFYSLDDASLQVPWCCASTLCSSGDVVFVYFWMVVWTTNFLHIDTSLSCAVIFDSEVFYFILLTYQLICLGLVFWPTGWKGSRCWPSLCWLESQWRESDFDRVLLYLVQ